MVRVLGSELSEIEGFSDDEDADPDFTVDTPECPTGTDDLSSDEEEIEGAPSANPPLVLRDKGKEWRRNDVFDPLPAASPIIVDENVERVNPFDAFLRYVPIELLENIAEATTQRILQNAGRETLVSLQTLNKFFGINIIMSYLRFPRIRMYWVARTRVPQIADNMSRNMFS